MATERHTTTLRMDAYYYGFEPTGIELIDRILSAVACAGKAYHHTEDWEDETAPYDAVFRGANPVEWIQHAAEDAAVQMRELEQQIRAPLRDYFAGQALARLVGLYDVDEPALLPERYDEFARLAYALADAMLRVRGE